MEIQRQSEQYGLPRLRLAEIEDLEDSNDDESDPDDGFGGKKAPPFGKKSFIEQMCAGPSIPTGMNRR